MTEIISIAVWAASVPLFFIFEKQHLVNHGDTVPKLDIHQSATYRFPDVGGMDRFAA